MNSILLYNWAHVLKAIMVLLSLLLLLKGHNEPGGGFVGGLVAGTAFILHALAQNVKSAREAIPISPPHMISLGLLIALGSGVPGLFREKPFLTGQWETYYLPVIGELTVGTPLLFDAGVYFVVTGIVLLITFAILESNDAS